MELFTAKLLSMLALGFGSFFAGMIPASISVSRRRRHPMLVSCLLCFGAGVLLSTSLAHMLPEAREKLPENTELLFCIGFFLVYLVDELVHLFYRSHGPDASPVQSYGSQEQTCLLRENGEMCHEGHQPCSTRSGSGVVGLLAALLVHSALEGLAIGLQESASEVILLLAAVCSHKFVVGFCLGAELCDSFPGNLCIHIACVSLFSGGSVAGIAAGAGLDTLRSLQDSTAVPVMQAIAAGTLLYVTVSEVLPRERARWHDRKRSAGIYQLISVCVGFTLMYLTTMYLDYDGA